MTGGHASVPSRVAVTQQLREQRREAWPRWLNASFSTAVISANERPSPVVGTKTLS